MKDRFPNICFTTSQENENDYFPEYGPNQVPVTFEWNGNKVRGMLTNGPGAGGEVWHLSVNNFHWGQLVLTQSGEWRFSSNTKDLEHLSEYFGEQVRLWKK